MLLLGTSLAVVERGSGGGPHLLQPDSEGLVVPAHAPRHGLQPAVLDFREALPSASRSSAAVPKLPSQFVATLSYGGAMQGGAVDGPVSNFAGSIAVSEPHAFYQWSSTTNAKPTWGSVGGPHEEEGLLDVITMYTRLMGGTRCDWWTSDNLTSFAHDCVCTHETSPIFPWPSLPGAHLSRRSVACPELNVTLDSSNEPNTTATGVCDRWRVPVRPDIFWW